MTSKPIYFCVYRITNLVENKHYYGYKSSNKHPSEVIGISYFGSPSGKTNMWIIKDQKENPQNYKYKIVQMFKTKNEALAREIKLHNKFDVGVNKNFYNETKQTSTGFDTTGKFVAKDKNGNRVLTNIDDPRRLTGEIISVRNGKVSVKNADGVRFTVESNDPRYISGELVGISKGLAPMKDNKGRRYIVEKDDPRILTGELFGLTKGRICPEEERNKIAATAKNNAANGVTFGPTHRANLSKGCTGIPKSKESIDKGLITRKLKGIGEGKNHWKFKYYYRTPWGIFDSPEALEPEFTMSRMKNFCITSDKKMYPSVYRNCLKLQETFDSSCVGKTYKELGFWVIPKEEYNPEIDY